jgi:hypothetical protein
VAVVVGKIVEGWLRDDAKPAPFVEQRPLVKPCAVSIGDGIIRVCAMAVLLCI